MCAVYDIILGKKWGDFVLEIIYRIYEVCEIENADDWRDDGKRIVSQEVLICESRNRFKEIIKDLYSDEDIRFKASRNYPVGQKYCVIIGEQCYSTESYTTIIKHTCDTCDVEFLALSKHVHSIDKHTLEYELGANYDKYSSLKFCSNKCKCKGIEKARLEYMSEMDLPDNFNGWVSSDNLTAGKGGYIYKITKRSTGEFYVGQSIYAPVFRWGQHLKTSRFPLSDIEDYIFEVIESVEDVKTLNDREKYWIQTTYLQCPEKSLNISLTKNIPIADESQMQLAV